MSCHHYAVMQRGNTKILYFYRVKLVNPDAVTANV